MNLRWLIGNFADPEFNLTRAQQREVTRLAHHKHLRGRTLLTWTLAMTFAGCLLTGFGWDPLASALARVGLQPARWISIMTIVMGVSVIAAWLYRFIYARPVRMAMRDLGYDVCVDCGYRLQGLNEDIHRCPECGTIRPSLPKKHGDQGKVVREFPGRTGG